jgi:HD superfamily phosphodiesterase
VSLAAAYFHDQYGARVQCDQIEFAATGAEIAQQDGRTLRFEQRCRTLLGETADRRSIRG